MTPTSFPTETAVLDKITETIRELEAGTLGDAASFDSLLQCIAEAGVRLLDASGATVAWCDWERDELEIRALVGDDKSFLGHRFPIRQSLSGRAVVERRGFASTWEEGHSIFHPSVLDRIPPQHSAAAPLILKGRAVGCLYVFRLIDQTPFSGVDVHVLTIFAQQAALLVGNQQLGMQLGARERLIRMLSDSTRAVNSQLDLDAVLRNTLNRILMALGAEVGSIMLIDDETRELVIRWSRGIPDEIAKSFRLKVGEGIAGYTAQTGEPLLVDRVANNSRFIRFRNQESFSSMISVPLKSRDRLVGVLNIDSFSPDRLFTADDLKLVSALAETVGVALENSRLFKQVQTARDFIQSTVDSVGDIIVTLDRQLTVTSINAAWKRTPKPDLPPILRDLELGKPFPSVEDDSLRTHWEAACRRVSGGATGDAPTGHVEEVSHESGSDRRWTRICLSPLIDGNGETLGLTCAATDVTALEQAANQIARQARLLENVHDAVIELDLDGRIVYWNEGAEQLFGWREAEVLGRDTTELYPPDWRERIPRHVKEVLQGRVIIGNFRAWHREKGEFWINMRAEKVVDTHGRTTGLLNLARDITEQVRTAEELKRRNEELTALNEELEATRERLVQTELLQALGKMADGIAHNFNNLLTIILGNTQLLLTLTDNPQVHKRLQSTERAALDGAALVRRIQDFTQVRAHAEPEPIHLHELVEQTIHFTEARWKDTALSNGTRISLLPDLQAVPPVSGNPSELREVCVSLIFNAVESMPDGGSILCRTFVENGSVCLQIVDSGRGIPNEVLPHVFEPFFTTKGVAKSGLGLSAAQGIVRRHKGEIRIESTVGKGTTATVRLPAAEETAVAVAPADPPPVSSDRPTAGRASRILVIDDEPEICDVVAANLKNAGYRTVIAGSGTHGIELFQQSAFDLVITDLGMPGLTGWDVARLVKSLDRKVPIIVLTGWGSRFEGARLRESGVDVVLEKPVRYADLVGAVERLLEAKIENGEQ